MRTRFLLILLMFGLLAGCNEQPAPEAVVPEQSPAETVAEAQSAFRTYDARTFFMTTSYGAASSAGFAFNPDGTKVLLSSDESGVFNAITFDVESGESHALTQSDTNAIFAISYFPADERMLYTFDEGGNELNHVYVREADGSNRDLTPGENVKASFSGWLDGGESFLVRTNERNGKNFDVYRYATDDYSRELIFENEAGWAIGDVSSDGRWLALDKPRTSADSDIFLKDMSDDSEPINITPHEGNVSHQVNSFGPEDKKLYYLTDEFGEFTQAWSHDLASGEKALDFAADWDVLFLGFSHTGRYRVYGVNADALTVITLIDTETGENVALPELPAGDLRNIRFSSDDSKMAFFINADTQPNDLFVLDLAAGTARQYTNALNPEIDPAHLVKAEVVRYESIDGLKIPSILYKPKQASPENKVPAMVLVHGGPGGQTRLGYRALVQHLVNHGYAILGANNRGSSGYGKTFFHLDDKRHGEDDLNDIVWGRKYLESLDWVDPQRIGVIGGSYGGYMTAAALTFHPEVFDVGIDIFGVTNWERTLASIPPWWESFKESLYDEMGDPATDAERHHAISPLFHAHQIRRPLLVIQGANDPRVLQAESDELVAAVQANEVPVEYVVFDDEGHGFRKRENRITASDAYLNFLDRYLKNRLPAERLEE
jgi:dipeptidyl aminopeptidase/acylaminoacyl peptidase